jgi:hypothetical protein
MFPDSQPSGPVAVIALGKQTAVPGPGPQLRGFMKRFELGLKEKAKTDPVGLGEKKQMVESPKPGG